MLKEQELMIIITEGKVSDVLAPIIHRSTSGDVHPFSEILAKIKNALIGMEHDQRKIIKGIKNIVV